MPVGFKRSASRVCAKYDPLPLLTLLIPYLQPLLLSQPKASFQTQLCSNFYDVHKREVR